MTLRSRSLLVHLAVVVAVMVLLDPLDIGRIIQFRALGAGVLPFLSGELFHPYVLQTTGLALLCAPIPLLLPRRLRPLLIALSAIAISGLGLSLSIAFGKPLWGAPTAAAGIVAGHVLGSVPLLFLRRRDDSARLSAPRRPRGGTLAARLGRTQLVLVGTAAAAASAVALIGIPFLVLPLQQSMAAVEQSDAVVVLGPAEPARIALALRAADEAPTLTVVISSSVREDRFVDERCGTTDPVRILCFAAVPFTTAGEASAVSALASEESWDRVAFVTSLPHVSRARRVMEQCTTLDVAAISASSPSSPSDWSYAYLYQLIATTKELLRGPC
ncbi:YdcF family protein [Rathayibacter festucae]|uniref:ElyC/SanA/YdcF family protein n=1 Tax=Rathayibacter festucae TaxID=110937 RepID=UPI001FB2E21D|nr:ElyC/SanA/YdcF family protein [Rathayibacter festucae]MCJ1699659.1 YdcF family protein [Rathayibacter festucae]